MSALTIVMYHYVRDVTGTRYPGLKALSPDAFEGQLDYIVKHYAVCTTRDVIAAVRGEHELPRSACVLTFDDGLLDHFTVVLPRLLERGLPASFYPPAAAVEQRVVLDTHKIQFILASAPDHGKLMRRVLEMIDGFRDRVDLPAADALREQWAHPFWLDSAETVLIKRVLQRALPKEIRAGVVGALFEECVGVAEQTLAQELYMDLSQLRCMLRNGMELGGHGANHDWLASLRSEEQDEEIGRTAAFLGRAYGSPPSDWVMSYPFGSYDAVTLELLAKAGCALGLTTEVGVVSDLSRPLELARLDTNELPHRGDAAVARWTVDALRGGALR